MKVALAHDFLIKLGGAERVLKALADMFPRAPIFTLFYNEKKVGSVFPKDRIKGTPLQAAAKLLTCNFKFLTPHRSLLPLMPTAVEGLDFSDYDLVLSSNTALMHGIVTNVNTRHICYCHSPARYLWDYKNRYQEEIIANRRGSIFNFKFLILNSFLPSVRQWDQGASKRETEWVANSKNVQKRIHKYFRRASCIVYPPVDVRRFEVSERHDDYFLIVCTLTAYKKVDLAVELFNRLRRRLIVIGDGPERERLQKMSQPNIQFLGFQSDEVVTRYMQNCRAFLFLSEDDFGITPVEAMACGKPVIAYGAGGALETVIVGSTGELFAQQTVDGLEAALARFFIRERSYDPWGIRKFAERFDEKMFRKNMRKIIAETTSEP